MTDLNADKIGSVTFDTTEHGYDPVSVDSFLAEVTELVRRLEGSAPELAEGQEPPAFLSRALDSLRASAQAAAAETLEAAAEQAEGQVAAARAEADQLRQDAIAEGERAGAERGEALVAARAAELEDLAQQIAARRADLDRLQVLCASLATTLNQAAEAARAGTLPVAPAAATSAAGAVPTDAEQKAEADLEDAPGAVPADHEDAALGDETVEAPVDAVDDVDELLADLAETDEGTGTEESDDRELGDEAIDTSTPLTAFIKRTEATEPVALGQAEAGDGYGD